MSKKDKRRLKEAAKKLAQFNPDTIPEQKPPQKQQ
jgi:hypothetical protein